MQARIKSPALALRGVVSAAATNQEPYEAIAEYRFAAADFIEALRPLTLLGRMTGFRRVPMHVRVPRATTGSTVSWVGESKPTKISTSTIPATTIKPISKGPIKNYLSLS